MILCVRQLRLPVEQLGFGGRSLIDTRKQVDQVIAWSAGRGEMNNDVTVTVEPAGVTHVRIVVRGDVDVVVLGPADTFEVDRDRSTNGTRSRSHADDAGLDDKMSQSDRLISIA